MKPGRSSIRRRRLAATLSLVVLTALGVGAWLVGSRVQSADQAAARAAPPTPSRVTSEVESRVLASTIIMRGDVVPALSVPVNGPTLADEAAGVVTGVFVQQGDELTSGDRLLEVSGRPVFVFEGATPVYRALRPGMTGADVGQMQAALVGGGCDAGDSETYDEATKQCVEAFYTDAGYAALRGSDTEIADLADAERAVADATDRLAIAQNAQASAAVGPVPADIAAADAALGDAQRAYDNAVAEQPRLMADAVAGVDAALVGMNAVLAGGGADDAGTPSSGGEQGVDSQGSAEGSGNGAASGSSDRFTAAEALREAVDNVADAGDEGSDAVAAATDTLTSAKAAVDALAEPSDVSVEQLAVDQATAAVERSRQDLADLEAVSGAIVPFGEIVFVTELPARVDDLNAGVGQGLGDSGAEAAGQGASTSSLATLASPELQVDVPIALSSSDLIAEGMEVELLDEQSGETAQGTLRSIGTNVVEAATSGAPSYPGVIDADVPDDWSGKNLRVTFTTAATEGPVLVVPVAAVLSSPSGATYVQVEADDRTVRTVDVDTGVSADGFVAVTARGDGSLSDGDRVVVG